MRISTTATLAGFWLCCGAANAADINLEATSTSKAGSANALAPASVVVEGAQGRYTKTRDGKLRFQLNARVRKGGDFDRHVATYTAGTFRVDAQGGDSVALKRIQLEPWSADAATAWLGGEWKTYTFEYEYQDPLVDEAARKPRSPVALCNDLLRSKSGAAREQMLAKGATLPLAKAYAWRGTFHYTARARGRTFDEPASISASGHFPLSIRCQNLVGPAPRTESHTRGAPPRPGKPLSETSPIRNATLRIEPSSQVVQARPGQLCPTSLRVYAAVAASRAFRGRALVFGTAFLSPATPLEFNAGGNRNFIVTYPLKWTGGAPSGKAIAGGDTSPLSQSLHLTLNVVDGDDKVAASSGRMTFDVACKPMPPPGRLRQR